MNKDQIIILKERGIISISGDDTLEFLQNIITNDITKVNLENSIFSAILSPQGKYLFEFFVVYFDENYFLDCHSSSTKGLMDHLNKYNLGSKLEIKDLTSKYVVGILNKEKLSEIQDTKKNTFIYRESPIYIDPRENRLGARILSPLEKIHLTIKNLKLSIIDEKKYYDNAFKFGIPEQGTENLKNQLFGLEANFEKLNAIDFKKGCYIGQENTARMKLKNKLRRKLLPIKCERKIKIDDEIFFNGKKIGKVLIDKPYPFALINMYDPDFLSFKNETLQVNNYDCKILDSI